MVKTMNFIEVLNGLTEFWSPQVVGRLNGQTFKVAKLKGERAGLRHDDRDELYLIVKGVLRIQFDDGMETRVSEGECCVVPMGTLHNPVADDECWIMVIETATSKIPSIS